ncbi:hypothetical protein BD626DRAFT_511401, partial [Schizophyllum amplum]
MSFILAADAQLVGLTDSPYSSLFTTLTANSSFDKLCPSHTRDKDAQTRRILPNDLLVHVDGVGLALSLASRPEGVI